MRFTLGRKIWALSLSVFFFVGAATLCVYWQMRDAMQWQQMIIAVKWPSALVFSDIQANMNLSRMVLRDIVLDYDDHDKQQKDIDRYQKIEAKIDASIDKLGVLSHDFLKEENKQRAKTIADGVPVMRQAELAAIEQAKQGQQKAALATLRTVLPTVNSVRDSLGELQEQNNTLSATIFRSIESDMKSSVLWLAGCFAIVLALGCAVSWRLARSVSGNAAALARRAEEIANGDLTGAPLIAASKDEFADLTVSTNQMQRQLQQLLRKVGETSGGLTEASEKISESSNHSASTARQQTDQTNTVATAIHEMTATVKQVSEHSHTAAEAAASAAATAQEGGEVVRNTLQIMQRIADSNERIAERVTKLGESSQQVGTIAAVIDDIADQTNLLALNAAIEAARAGEQGRGFAVVADEVRKLAERTTSATKEIAQILAVVLDESRNTASAMSEGRADVDAGLQGARQAGEALERIIQVATNVGDMVSQIATAARQQSTATEEIQNSAQRIARMATDSSSAASQSAAACDRLSELAMRLQEVVRVFHLSEESSAIEPWSTHHLQTNLPTSTPMSTTY